MGFYKENIGTIWKIEDKGKYSTAQITCGKKNKDTGEFETEFNGFVTLLGTAHEKGKTLEIPEGKGVRIRFGNGDVTTNYVAEKKITYTNYKLFSFHTVSWDNASGKWVDDDDEAPAPKKPATKSKKAPTPPADDGDGDDELPF